MRRMLGRPNRSLALYIALPFVAMVLLWRAVGLWLKAEMDRAKPGSFARIIGPESVQE